MIRHDLLAPGIALGGISSRWGTCCWSRTGRTWGWAARVQEMGWRTRVKGGGQVVGANSQSEAEQEGTQLRNFLLKCLLSSHVGFTLVEFSVEGFVLAWWSEGARMVALQRTVVVKPLFATCSSNKSLGTKFGPHGKDQCLRWGAKT